MPIDPEILRRADDAELRREYDNVVADYALALKYPHNTKMRRAIASTFDQLYDEMRRRGLEPRQW